MASVVEAMNDYLYQHNANTHWAYPTSEETDAIIDSARSVLADFLNATPAEIVFEHEAGGRALSEDAGGSSFAIPRTLASAGDFEAREV